MQTLAIIPARGGSKSIPRKNVRFLAGKPLIAHTIEQARQAKLVNRVVVSTDDAEIAAVSQQYNAEIVWRPAEISGDTATSEAALLYTLSFLREQESYLPDILVFLQCTSPLTLAADMDASVWTLLESNADSALAVVPFHYFLWQPTASGEAIGINHDKRVRPLRQQRAPQYLETGAVYVMRTQGFLEAKHRFFGKTVMYVMPTERCLEIDEPVDFEIAEHRMRQQQQQRYVALLPQHIGALVLDFDGVFTDNKVWVLEDGREAVRCDRSDGLGLAKLKCLGLPILVLSSEKNLVVQARCDKLNLTCCHGIQDKLASLKAWLSEINVPLSEVVYVGNDMNDLACLQAVGCGIVVHDAYPDVRAAAKIILASPGGQGAIREVTELINQRLEEDDYGKQC